MEQITVGNIHFFFFAFFLFSSFLSSGLFVFSSIVGLVSSAFAFSMVEASFAESASSLGTSLEEVSISLDSALAPWLFSSFSSSKNFSSLFIFMYI